MKHHIFSFKKTTVFAELRCLKSDDYSRFLIESIRLVNENKMNISEKNPTLSQPFRCFGTLYK